MICAAALALVAGLTALIALVTYLFLAPSPGLRRLGVFGAWALLAPLPLLIPSWEPGSALPRFFAAILVVLTGWRLYDLHVGYPVHGRPPLADFARFMFPKVGHLVFRRIGSEPGPDRSGNMMALRLGVLELSMGGLALFASFTVIDWRSAGFAPEHVSKWIGLYLLIDGSQRVGTSATRLLGHDAMAILDDPIVARTPAEFWRRYNRMVGEWLFVNVFRRRAFRGQPGLAILATFTVSGLMHEYLFGVALLRVQGYQLAFFLLHGVAVLFTARLKPTGGAAVFGVVATIVFTLATLVLFTASVEAVLEPLGSFYATERPRLWAG